MFFHGRKNNALGTPVSIDGFGSTYRLIMTSIAIVIFVSAFIAEVDALATPQKVYRYFGYGSNVIPSTMKTLRQIEVREVTAAVLPGYELKFESAAFVRPVRPVRLADQTETEHNTNQKINDVNDGPNSPRSDRVVHGLLYTLTEDEFAKVGQTEGVPFGYRWQKCQVYPYRGDGKSAGMDCLEDPEALSIQAYTLVEPTPASSQQKQQQQKRKQENQKRIDERGSVPPSASYLGLIKEGARLWKFDKAYQEELASIQPVISRNILFPDGWEGPTLELAERAFGIKRTYMIDGY